MLQRNMMDPAFEAAQRAWSKRRLVGNRPRLHMEAAAREALKPVRDLHIPVPETRIGERNTNYEYQVQVCDVCRCEWPCDTAPLIYTEDELSLLP